MKRVIVFILTTCTCLFSIAGANNTAKPASGKDLYRIAFEMAADPEYRKAFRQTVLFHQHLVQSNALNEIRILGTDLASETQWKSFLSKTSFNDRQSFFRYTSVILESYNKVFDKHMLMLNFSEKNEVMGIAARIFSWNYLQGKNMIVIDCMTAYMAASSFCVALWDLQSAQGNPMASANFAFCMSSNVALYQLCAVIFN